MFRIFLVVLLAISCSTFTSCRHGRTGQQGDPGVNGNDGQNGQDGQDGQDGIDGQDGLDGIGFDYVRGMEGAVVCNSALIVPANLVVPANILALAPENGGRYLDGLTLTFGHVDSPVRAYLGAVAAGEYCVLEKRDGDDDDDDDDDDNRRWTPVGERLIFTEDGFVAIIPPEFYNFVSPPVFADALLNAHVVDFTGKCYELHYHEDRHIKLGKGIRINFRRD